MKLFLLITCIPFIFFAQDFQSNLPIILINTDGNEILDEERIICDMGIISHYNQLNNLSDPFNNY